MSNNIHTVLTLDETRDELITYIWDAFKSVYGSRPRTIGLGSMSLEELRSWESSLSAQIEWDIEEEEIDKGGCPQYLYDRWVVGSE